MDNPRRDIHNSELPVVCRACEARHGGVCGAMNTQQLAELSKYTTRKKLASGAELQGQGEKIAAYANILKGVVKLTKMLSDGRQQIVGLQFAPDFLGRPFSTESSLTVEAATESEICSMPKAVLDRLVAGSPELEHRLHNQALAELDEARDWMLTLGRKTAQEKVASFLYMIATHFDPESLDETNFDLPLSRADIADFLGLTIETVSRQMTKLRADGVIQVENNRHVRVPDMDRLAEVAGMDI
jgi:CRP/FNR family transcriptional regulator